MAYYGNNSLDPQAPEYGKAWKAEFNFGCCTSCGKVEIPVCTTVTSYITRTNQSDALVVRVENDYNCPCQNAKLDKNCGCD